MLLQSQSLFQWFTFLIDYTEHELLLDQIYLPGKIESSIDFKLAGVKHVRIKYFLVSLFLDKWLDLC